MRRVGLALSLVVLGTLPAYSQSHICSDVSYGERMAFLHPDFQNGQPGLIVDGVWQPMSVAACSAKATEKATANKSLIDSIVAGIGPAEQAVNQDLRNRDPRQCQFGEQNVFQYLRLTDTPRASFIEVCIKESQAFQQPAHNAVSELANIAAAQGAESVRQWEFLCKEYAREYAERRQLAEEENRRERQAAAAISSGIPESYTSQKNRTGFAEPARKHAIGASEMVLPSIPDSGGAGGSEAVVWEAQPAYEWKLGPDPSAVPDSGGAGGSEVVSPQSQPSAIPDSGGAGGSERTRIASVPPTTQAQQGCDPKSFGDAQLRLLLSDPKLHARLTNLIAEEPAPRKSKTERQNRHERRGRAPTDADFARPNSGMSPETANAIGTMIGVGIGVGLNNIGRRGTSGAAPRPGSNSTAPRRGTYDAAPR